MLPSRSASSKHVCQILSAPTISLGARRARSTRRLKQLFASKTPDEREAILEKHNSRTELKGPRHIERYFPKTSAKSKGPEPSAAFDLFNDVVNPRPGPGQPASRRERQEAFIQAKGEKQPSWRLAGTTMALERNKELSTQAKLETFRAEIWPQIVDLNQKPLPRHLLKVVSEFLEGLTMAKASEGDITSGHVLSDLRSKIGNRTMGFRVRMLINCWLKLMRTAEDDAGVDGTPVSQDENVEETLDPSKADTRQEYDDTVREMLDQFRVISRLKRRLPDNAELQFMFPSAVDMDRFYGASPESPAVGEMSWEEKKKHILRSFKAMFPSLGLDEAIAPLMPALLLTAAVLADTKLTSPELRAEAEPLLATLSHALKLQPFASRDVQQLFAGVEVQNYLSDIRELAAEMETFIVDRWGQVLDVLNQQSVERQVTLGKPIARSQAQASNRISTIHRHLRAAYKARSVGGIVRKWDAFAAELKDNPILIQTMRGESGAEVLNYVSFIWCAVRRPERMQATLALMAEMGVQPTLKTYTAMMHGWKTCKDGDSVEELWAKLVESGVNLDVPAWTERISALVETGRMQDALGALGEMAQAWKTAHERDPRTNMTKPTIEVVNAVVKGLGQETQTLQNLLDWARREGIEPNVRTFNILLKEHLIANNPEAVQGTLTSMTEAGVEPDSATFTIFMDNLFGGLPKKASAEEEVRAVEQMLSDIELAGLKPNLETYGKMLYTVASIENGSDAAVEAVQTHMRRQGFSVTPHMVTILIERYVRQRTRGANSRDTSNGIAAILRKHGLTDISRGDQTLWERVMSGYALTGYTTEALQVFDDSAAAGRPVTSLAGLLDLLKALLAEGMTAEAAHVARSVVKSKTAMGEGGGGGERYWRHHFWHVVLENRVLRREDVPAWLWEKIG